MKLYVAGVLTSHANDVLLVKRGSLDPQMPNLWSLPGGAVNEGEHPEDALRREVMEECSLDVRVGQLLSSIIRQNWQITFFRIHVETNSLHSWQPGIDIDDIRFFAVHALPEHLVLEAYIGILKISTPNLERLDATTYTRLADGLFSALFYSYLASSLDRFRALPEYELLSHVVLNTPYRKFKSCIPYLLADCTMTSIPFSLVAEIAFAIFTILDDVCDARQFRYDRPTVLSHFGVRAAKCSLFTIVRSLETHIARHYENSYRTAIIDDLFLCGYAEAARFSQFEFPSSQHYLTEAAVRTRFLGTAWAEGLMCAAKARESDFIRSFHRDTSLFGQLLNDYFDLCSDNGLEDFRSTTISFYSTLLWELLGDTSADARLFSSLWWGPRSEETAQQFGQLLERYEIRERMRQELAARLLTASDTVLESSLSDAKKSILIGWLVMSCKDIQGPEFKAYNYRSCLLELVDAVESLSSEADRHESS